MVARYLVVRPQDLTVFGIDYAGFSQSGQTLTAGDNARLYLFFPPQAVAEEKFGLDELDLLYNHGLWRLRAASLSGMSVLQLAVDPGASLRLNAEGIVSLLGSGKAHLLTGTGSREGFTLIEMPWRLTSSVKGPNGEEVVDLRAEPGPLASNGTSGLWHLDLLAAGAATGNANLRLVPWWAEKTYYFSDAPFAPLSLLQREEIVQARQDRQPLPHVSRLELSALGGSIQVDGLLPGAAWQHEVRHGREMLVRFEYEGVLFPYGHRAVLSEHVAREFTDKELVGSVAALVSRPTLKILETIVVPASEPTLARRFPFDSVEVLEKDFRIARTDLQPVFPFPGVIAKPMTPGGQTPLQVPVRLRGRGDDITFTTPVVFIRDYKSGGLDSLSDGRVADKAIELWGSAINVPLPGRRLDLVRADVQRPGDVHELHAITLDTKRDGASFGPILDGMEVELPALRDLMPDAPTRVHIAYHEDYIASGPAVPIALKLRGDRRLDINFRSRPDRSGGLVVPQFAADALSPNFGPTVAGDAVAALREILKSTKLLGIQLGDIVDEAIGIDPNLKPRIVPRMVDGKPAGAEMTWKLPLKGGGIFTVKQGASSELVLTVKQSGDKRDIACTISNFELGVPPGKDAIVKVGFDKLAFFQTPGQAPSVDTGRPTITFHGALDLLSDVLKKMQELIGSGGPTIRATPSGISAAYELAVPAAGSGVFVMRNVAARIAVNIPFEDSPVTVTLGLSRRDAPFNLAVMMFGGGGYVQFTIGPAGFLGLEASLEFGAIVAINFVVVSAEVHAVGGVRFELAPGSSTPAFTAFLRIGGSVELLGLISVTVELLIELAYYPDEVMLRGRAVLVVDVDVALFSESVRLDSGVWEFSAAPLIPGGPGGPPPPLPPVRMAGRRGRSVDPAENWRRYQGAFA